MHSRPKKMVHFVSHPSTEHWAVDRGVCRLLIFAYEFAISLMSRQYLRTVKSIRDLLACETFSTCVEVDNSAEFPIAENRIRNLIRKNNNPKVFGIRYWVRKNAKRHFRICVFLPVCCIPWKRFNWALHIIPYSLSLLLYVSQFFLSFSTCEWIVRSVFDEQIFLWMKFHFIEHKDREHRRFFSFSLRSAALLFWCFLIIYFSFNRLVPLSFSLVFLHNISRWLKYLLFIVAQWEVAKDYLWRCFHGPCSMHEIILIFVSFFCVLCLVTRLDEFIFNCPLIDVVLAAAGKHKWPSNWNYFVAQLAHIE